METWRADNAQTDCCCTFDCLQFQEADGTSAVAMGILSTAFATPFLVKEIRLVHAYGKLYKSMCVDPHIAVYGLQVVYLYL